MDGVERNECAKILITIEFQLSSESRCRPETTAENLLSVTFEFDTLTQVL